MTQEEKERIIKLIDSYKNEDAIKVIEKILINETDEKNESYLNYLLSFLFKRLNENRKSNNYAVKCINSKYPDPRVYKLFAETNKDRLVSINYLKQGLLQFPNSSSIYQGLIQFLPEDEVEVCLKEIQDKNLEELSLMHACIKYKIEHQKWDIQYFTDKLLYNTPDYDNDFVLYIKLLKGISLNFNKKYADAEKILKECISEDLNNILLFSAHIGLIWVYSTINDICKVEKYMNLIDFSRVTDLLVGPYYPIITSFTALFKQIEKDVVQNLRTNKTLMDKSKLLFSLTRFSQYIDYGIINFNKQDLKVFEKAYNKEKLEFLLIRKIQAYLYYKDYENLIKCRIEYKKQQFDLKNYEVTSCIVENNIDSQQIYRIIEIINNEFKNKYCEINESDFFNVFIDDIIQNIWDSGEHSKEIYMLCQNFTNECLMQSDCLFELAYSFRNYDINKSKLLYETILNKNDKNISALNNLAMIYEEIGDLEKAFELLKQGKELTDNDEYINRNYKRISDYIELYTKGLTNLKNESIYILTKLNILTELLDDKNMFQLSYRDRSKILQCGNEKADEILQKLIDSGYIIKQKVDTYNPNKYLMNPLVVNELKNLHNRIKENKKYNDLAVNLNLDNLENIGYIALKDKLQQMNDINYRTIAHRDLQECALAYLLGNYKTVMIFSGSIIENILIDKISSMGATQITVSNGKKKKIIDAELFELINHFNNDPNLSDSMINHLMEIARIYRNIVHPANEIKKDYHVSKVNADLCWSTLQIIINSLY